MNGSEICYKTYHFKYEDESYAIIIKEYCDVNEDYFNRVIDGFLEYTIGDMSLSYISSEFLFGDIKKTILDSYFKRYKNNNGPYTGYMEQWHNMLMELKSKKIYVKDFNGSNVGIKQNGNLGIIELGLGYVYNIKLDKNDEIKYE